MPQLEPPLSLLVTALRSVAAKPCRNFLGKANWQSASFQKRATCSNCHVLQIIRRKRNDACSEEMVIALVLGMSARRENGTR